MTIASFGVGILGVLVSVLALFYAALAARRSDALLRRLVIYPFRELDISFAELNDAERRGLLALYSCTAEGRQAIDAAIITEARTLVTDLNPMMLSFLVQAKWLEGGVEAGAYRFNRDRLPYLHFVVESESIPISARA